MSALQGIDAFNIVMGLGIVVLLLAIGTSPGGCSQTRCICCVYWPSRSAERPCSPSWARLSREDNIRTARNEPF